MEITFTRFGIFFTHTENCFIHPKNQVDCAGILFTRADTYFARCGMLIFHCEKIMKG